MLEIFYRVLSTFQQLPQNPAFCAVSFESWHLGLIMGSVILVSSCRFLLLMIWPDFAESSEAANQQVYALICHLLSGMNSSLKLVLNPLIYYACSELTENKEC